MGISTKIPNQVRWNTRPSRPFSRIMPQGVWRNRSGEWNAWYPDGTRIRDPKLVGLWFFPFTQYMVEICKKSFGAIPTSPFDPHEIREKPPTIGKHFYWYLLQAPMKTACEPLADKPERSLAQQNFGKFCSVQGNQDLPEAFLVLICFKWDLRNVIDGPKIGSSGWSNYSPELRGPEMCFSPRFSGHHRSFWPLHDDLMRPITPAGASERSTASAMHDDNFRSTREVSRELGNQPSSSQFVACFLFYGQTIETAITTLYFQLWENSLTMNDGYSPYHESNTSYSHHTPYRLFHMEVSQNLSPVIIHLYPFIDRVSMKSTIQR